MAEVQPGHSANSKNQQAFSDDLRNAYFEQILVSSFRQKPEQIKSWLKEPENDEILKRFFNSRQEKAQSTFLHFYLDAKSSTITISESFPTQFKVIHLRKHQINH